MELNNTIAKPLYKQLEDQLKEEIDTGKRKAGSRLPTENELSTTYNVSRVTVRKALAGLSELGYLDRKSGKGTFVAEKRIQRNISKGVTGFSEMCRTMGAVPGAKTIKIAIEDPTEKDMELMHITPDKKILVLERIRYADEKPVLLKTPGTYTFAPGVLYYSMAYRINSGRIARYFYLHISRNAFTSSGIRPLRHARSSSVVRSASRISQDCI